MMTVTQLWHFFYLLLISWQLGIGSSSAQNPAISLADARKAFEEAQSVSMTDGGKLWGQPLYGPILFVDPETRFVVANQPDKENKLTEKEGVFLDTLPEEEDIANTAYTWAGVIWTMVIWPLPENRYSRTRLIMHECFHRIQGDLGLPGSNPANSHLDTKEGRTWLRLEWRALAEALIRREDLRRRAIEDALIFRMYRRSLFPQATAQERALELNEGLAEYTGAKLSGWPDWILADRAAIRLEQDDRSTNFVRSFAYTSGPAYGILLDETDVKWRSMLDSESDLGLLLGLALNVALPGDLASAVHHRAAHYNGSTVIAEEEARAEVQRQAIARHRNRFIDGPVLILPLGEGLRYTFNPRNAESLGEFGTVYLTTRVTDAWGVLEVSKGALLSRDKNGRMAEARVPAPCDISGHTLAGDGWTLTLNDGWSIVSASRRGDYTVVKKK